MEPLQPVLDRLARLLSEGEGGEAEECARLVATRVRHLRDHAHRVTALRQVFESVDDATLLATLNRLWVGSGQGLSDYREAVGEMASYGDLFQHMPYDRLSDLYRAARHCGLENVARLLLGDSHRWNKHVDEAVEENEFLEISAGERKSAARSRDRFVLDRILHDRNPAVIQALLQNPRIVERDVVRIAAMRPTSPEVLRAICENPRWSSRYEVRKALACNPYTPESLAVRFVATLLRQDLSLIARDHRLAAQVRAAAADRLVQRR